MFLAFPPARSDGAKSESGNMYMKSGAVCYDDSPCDVCALHSREAHVLAKCCPIGNVVAHVAGATTKRRCTYSSSIQSGRQVCHPCASVFVLGCSEPPYWETTTTS
jgi:hypothetical protein